MPVSRMSDSAGDGDLWAVFGCVSSAGMPGLTDGTDESWWRGSLAGDTYVHGLLVMGESHGDLKTIKPYNDHGRTF